MGKQFEAITDRQRAFIEEQPLFFVATAARDGRVNVSPKGLDSLRVLGAPLAAALLLGAGEMAELAAAVRVVYMPHFVRYQADRTLLGEIKLVRTPEGHLEAELVGRYAAIFI